MTTVWSSNIAIIRGVALACGLLLALAHAPAQAQDLKAAQFMQKVAAELISANRAGSRGAVEKTIRKYAAINIIASYSLGTYAAKLPRNKRGAYKKGMLKFMSRYFVTQSKNYKVASAKILGPGKPGENNLTMVDTRVTLKDGSTYDVRWALIKRRGSYKIRDAQVVGFWLTPFQRNLFRDYVRENGGNVDALVFALNSQ